MLLPILAEDTLIGRICSDDIPLSASWTHNRIDVINLYINMSVFIPLTLHVFSISKENLCTP